MQCVVDQPVNVLLLSFFAASSSFSHGLLCQCLRVGFGVQDLVLQAHQGHVAGGEDDHHRGLQLDRPLHVTLLARMLGGNSEQVP